MKANEEKGVFGWYRPAEGLRLTLRAEWRPKAGKAARPIGLELAHFDAGEGGEAPVVFTSIRSMAEFLARHDETMNDGLNSLATWGGLEVASGLAACWPAAGGGEVRLRFGPPGPEAAKEPPPSRIYSAPARIYDHEALAAPDAGAAAKAVTNVLAKILEELAGVEAALQKAKAEVGGFPSWAETIALLEAESFEWKRAANALYGAAARGPSEAAAAAAAFKAFKAGEGAAGPELPAEPPQAPEETSRLSGVLCGAGGGEGRAIWSPAPGAGEEDE